MRQLSTTINRIPMRTWDRLGVNEAKMILRKPKSASFTGATGISVSGQIVLQPDLDGLAFDQTFIDSFGPTQIGAFIDSHANWVQSIRIPKSHREKNPLVLTLRLDEDNPALMDNIVIEAEEGSSATVILYYTSETGISTHHCGRIRLLVGPNAKLKLVKAQMLCGETADHMDAIEGLVQENAQLEVVLAELGAAQPVSGCDLILAGDGGRVNLDIIYLGNGTRSLDMSYRVKHLGKKTASHIYAKGILLDRSKKVFRDTLDFISGASGSKGREEESVLMLSSQVRNISVPLLMSRGSTSWRPKNCWRKLPFPPLSKKYRTLPSKARSLGPCVNPLSKGG